LAYDFSVIFVESPAFCRWRDANLDDEHFRALQNVLIINPHAGELIGESGGLRMIRIGLPGRAKCEGARVIYYWWAGEQHFYLLFAYAANDQNDLTADQRKRLAQAMKSEVPNG
jgi:hypothetical protein